jgi:hypothetical protein
MRFSFAALVTAASLCMAPASAQVSTVPSVQLPRDVVTQPIILSTEQARLRRVAIARAAGATPPASGLTEATTLSVNAPSVRNARLQFNNLAYYLPHVSLYGSATMRANSAPGDISWVDIRFRADARTRYIIDCAITGPATRFQYERLTGGPRDPRENTTTSVSDGRVSMVTPAAAATGDMTVFLKGLNGNWYFHQCEIVPIR